MPITALKPQEFAKELAQQALSYAPADLTDEQKNFVAKKVFEFSIIAGNHIIERFKEQLDDEQGQTIIQFIGEWTFHKNIDIIRSNIPQEHWAEILQQVAFAALQTAIQCYLEKQDRAKIAASIEVKVCAAYENCIRKLAKAGVIPENKIKEIITQSNVDKMAKETSSGVPGSEEKIIKYAAFAIVLKKLPKEKIDKIVSKFSPEEQKYIMNYLQTEGLEQKLDPSIVHGYMQELKKTIAGITKPKLSKTISEIKALKKKFKDEKIFDLLSYERSSVLEFVENCLFEKKTKALKTGFSPFVAKILQEYLQSKLAPKQEFWN